MVILFVLLLTTTIYVQAQSPVAPISDGNREGSILLAMTKSTLARNNGSNGCWMKAIKEVERQLLFSNDDATSYNTIPGVDHPLSDSTAFCASLGNEETQTLALQLTVCHRTEHRRYIPPACEISTVSSSTKFSEMDTIDDMRDNANSAITTQTCLNSLDEGTFHMYTHFLRDTLLICNQVMDELNILRRRDASARLEAASLKLGESSRLMDRKISESLNRFEQIEVRSREMEESVKNSIQRQQEIEVISQKMEENFRDSIKHQEKFIDGMTRQENMTASVQMDMEAMKNSQEAIFISMSQQTKFVAVQQNLMKNAMKLYENTGLNQVQNTWGQIKEIMSWNIIILWLRLISTLGGTVALRLISRRFARALPLTLLLSCFKMFLEYLLYKFCHAGAIVEKDRDQGVLLLRRLEFPLYFSLHIITFLSSFSFKKTKKNDERMEESISRSMVHVRDREIQEMQDTIKMMRMQMELEREARRDDRGYSPLDLRNTNQRHTSLVPNTLQPNNLGWQPKTYAESNCPPSQMDHGTKDLFYSSREVAVFDDMSVGEHPQFVDACLKPEDLIMRNITPSSKRKRDTSSNNALSGVSAVVEGSSSKEQKRRRRHDIEI